MFSFLFVCVFGFVSRSRFVCLLPSREIYFSYLLFVSFTFNTISMQRVIKCQCCFVSKMHKQYSRHNLSRHWGEYARVSPFAMPIYCPPLWLRILLLRLFLYLFFLFFCSYFYVCFRVCCCCTKWMCSVVFAKQIFLYLFISNVARISPLCVLCFVCCVWLSNPLLTKYSLNSWTCTINPYQAVRTQILCFVFRSLSFKKKHAISPLLRPLVVVRYSTRWIAKLRLQYVPNSIVHASLIYKSIFIYVIWCCIAKQQQR